MLDLIILFLRIAKAFREKRRKELMQQRKAAYVKPVYRKVRNGNVHVVKVKKFNDPEGKIIRL